MLCVRALVCWCVVGAASGVVYGAPSPFVDVDGAAQLIARGALVLDARAEHDVHVPGAVAIDWRDFRDGIGRTGRLSDDDRALARKLGALGVDDHRPVVVYGAASKGWGEEGRIAWMLRYLGHKMTYVLDGGFAAWQRGHAVERGTTATKPGVFSIKRDPSTRVGQDEVAAAVRDHKATIIDVRTPEEWKGARLYYEARGGHIPGARFVPFTSLFAADGRAITKLDLPRDRPIYVYCTGGVRSAWATLLLRALGYDAKNYDASFWSWSATRSLPLE